MREVEEGGGGGGGEKKMFFSLALHLPLLLFLDLILKHEAHSQKEMRTS